VRPDPEGKNGAALETNPDLGVTIDFDSLDLVDDSNVVLDLD